MKTASDLTDEPQILATGALDILIAQKKMLHRRAEFAAAFVSALLTRHRLSQGWFYVEVTAYHVFGDTIDNAEQSVEEFT
jgi:hypothetical protein